MEEITLASIDSKGKIRIAAFQYEWSDDENGYVITRQTGCYGGKMTEQPAKVITAGKAKRTLAEQVALEFNSLVKKSKDKGYKELEKDLNEYTESELHEFVGKEVTGQNGIVKPQLAKQADKVTNLKVFDKEYYASRKIDGCFKGDTLISTDKGLLRIDKIVNERMQVNVLSYNTYTQKFEYKPIVNWFNNGLASPKEFVRIKLGDKKYLTCTKNHKFFSNGDWKPIIECTTINKKSMNQSKFDSLLMGTLLGDSCLSFEYRSKSVSFHLICSHKELELLEHKINVLGLEGKYKPYTSEYGSECWRFDSRTLTEDIDWTKFYHLNPENNRYERFIYSAEYLNNILDDSGISLWIADDGSITYNNGNHETPILTISTEGWSYEQVIEFQKLFQLKYNITPDFVTDKRKVNENQSGIRLKFRTKDTLQLLNILKYHKFKTVEYKYYYKDGEYEPEYTCLESITPEIIDRASGSNKVNKYDIEVADNHNYFANGFLVHNCRCLIYLGNDGNIHTSSRGAMNYDAAMMEIIEHPILIKLFQDNPTLILDGEAYKHGWSLASISGLMRTQVTAADYSIAEFYWYDIVNTNKSFEERLKIMNQIKSDLNLGFDPYKEWNDGDLRIQFVPQEPISGYDNMIKLHDQYVSEGWEGLVIRNKDDVYGPNKRTNSMIKLKQYKVDTFKVIGIEQGLRKYDDMCFVIEMSNGNTFKAKPMGNHELKVDYTENFETVYRNHLGDVKYFADSEHGVVQQPCFIAFRFDLE